MHRFNLNWEWHENATGTTEMDWKMKSRGKKIELWAHGMLATWVAS